MSKTRVGLAIALLLVASSRLAAQESPNDKAARAAFAAAGTLFAENQGQVESNVRFRTIGGTVTIDVLDDGLIVGNATSQTRIRIRGAANGITVKPFALQKTQVSYYLGNDPARWRTGVRTWGGVRWEGVRPGVDLEINGEGAILQARWVGRDGASAPPKNALDVVGPANSDAEALLSALDSPATLSTPSESFLTPQAIYASITKTVTDGDMITAVSFDSTTNRIWYTAHTSDFNGFVGSIDVSGTGPEQYLFFGGTGDDVPTAVATSRGGVAIAGFTSSSDFPISGNVAQSQKKGATDAFVARIASGASAGGLVMTRSTYAGGSADDQALAIQFCSATSDALCIAGWTTSPDLPAPSHLAVYHGQKDAAFIRMTADLTTFIYSSYFGGSGDDVATATAVDPTTGKLIAVGRTTSADLTTPSNAFQRGLRGASDCFIVNVGGGDSASIATYLGGAADDGCTGVVVDPAGFPIVAGTTSSGDLPVTPGVYQATMQGVQNAFITRLPAAMNAISWLTYFEALGRDTGAGITLDATGRIYLAGGAFPIVNDAPLGFLAIFTPDARGLLYSAGIGKSMRAVVAPSAVWVGGTGSGTDPTTHLPANVGYLSRILAPGTVEGTVFQDSDQDGKLSLIEARASLNNYSGVTVRSTGGETTSGAGGKYVLLVQPGEPQLCITVPPGKTPTTPTCQKVSIDAFATASNINFGLYAPPSKTVGTGSLLPSSANIDALDPLTYRFSWTHPIGWRHLHTLELLFVSSDQVLAWLRFEEESNTFTLFDPEKGQFGPRFSAGQAHRLETPYGSLIIPADAVDGPPGTTVTLTFDARFKPKASGLTMDLVAFAEDDNGTLQGPDTLGSVSVSSR
jgi:hypothetical protein